MFTLRFRQPDIVATEIIASVLVTGKKLIASVVDTGG